MLRGGGGGGRNISNVCALNDHTSDIISLLYLICILFTFVIGDRGG